MQAGFLNRPQKVRSHHETSFEDHLAVKGHLEQPTSRFSIGDQCEVIGGALVRESEDLNSRKVAQLEDGCRVEILEIGSCQSGKRLAIKDSHGLQGWLSVVARTGEPLLRLVQKAWRQKRFPEKGPRHDVGLPTAKFNVGDVCEVIGGAIVRELEGLTSSQLKRLPDKSEVEVVDIGTASSGKRVAIKDSSGQLGWISVVSADGTSLLRPLNSKALQLDIKVQEEAPKAKSRSPHEKPPPMALREAKGSAEPLVLVSASRVQKGFELEVPWIERDNLEQLLMQKFLSEGIQEPDYEDVKLRDARGHWYSSGESPEMLVPELFPITLCYRPPTPSQTAETALALRQRRALEALSPLQRSSLGEIQRLVAAAYSNQDDTLLQRALQMAHSKGFPLESEGLPRALMPESVLFPRGNEPILYDGRVYSMHSESQVVFDPPNFQVPMGIWNAQRQKIEPVVFSTSRQDGSDGREIFHFGKLYQPQKNGSLVDPETDQVVGMIDPLSGEYDFFDPIPVAVADFMMKRGFRLEAPSASLTNGPFVQILPQEESGGGSPELHLTMQSMGSVKALKYAPAEQRNDKQLMLKSMKEGTGPQSWKLMLFGAESVQNDREVLTEAVAQDYMAMQYASSFYDDRDFMLKAVERHGLALKYGSEDIRADPDLAYAAVKTSWRALKNVSENLRASSRIVREAVKQCWQALEYASEELRADKDILSLAVKQSWRSLHFAAPKLRRDSGLVLMALRQHFDALQYAADELLQDVDFMHQAVQIKGLALAYAAEKIAADRDLVLEAVRNDWRALQYADASLRSDRGVVLEAVRKHHDALKMALPDMQTDQELIFEAARKRPDFLRAVPESVRGDQGFMLRFVKLHPTALQFATETLRRDEALVLEALRRNWRALQFASSDLRASHSFMLKAVQVDALTLSLAAEEIRKDPDIVCEVLEREWEMLEHVDEELRSNYAFMMEAVCIEGRALKFAAEALRQDRDLVTAALRNCGLALEFAAEDLKANAELVLLAVVQDFEAIDFASEALVDDFLFMLRAVRVDGRSFKGASLQLRADPDLAIEAARQNWRSLKYAARSLRTNREFMLQAIRMDSFALAMAAEDLWMDPELVAAAAEGKADTFDEPGPPSVAPGVLDPRIRDLLKSARPNWSESNLDAAGAKLAAIGVTTMPLLIEALAGDLNGRLRAAGQKIFTATTIMELRARAPASAAARSTAKKGGLNARLSY